MENNKYINEGVSDADIIERGGTPVYIAMSCDNIHQGNFYILSTHRKRDSAIEILVADFKRREAIQEEWKKTQPVEFHKEIPEFGTGMGWYVNVQELIN